MRQTGLQRSAEGAHHSAAQGAAPALHRLLFVSRNFQELQGWRKVPAGVFLILQSECISNAVSEALPWKAPGLLLSLLFGLYTFGKLAGLFLWGAMITRYYDRAFGRIESRDGTVSPLPWLPSWPAMIIAILLPIEMLRSIDVGYYLPISLAGLAVAAIFAARPGAWRERPYCGALALVFFSGSLGLHRLPELHAKVKYYGVHSTVYHQALWIAFGLGLVLIGLLDHQLLVRSLPPAPAEDGE